MGQDIDARDDDGWTPLHAAVYWESVESAELLVLSGANMYAKTDAVSSDWLTYFQVSVLIELGII